jgi:hypothetical protein
VSPFLPKRVPSKLNHAYSEYRITACEQSGLHVLMFAFPLLPVKDLEPWKTVFVALEKRPPTCLLYATLGRKYSRDLRITIPQQPISRTNERRYGQNFYCKVVAHAVS